MVHGREGTERCRVYVGPRFGSFCVLLLKKINNMLLSVKIMLIYACVMCQHGNGDEWKLYIGNIIVQNL